MDNLTITIMVFAVFLMLLLFVILFIYILRLRRKARLQTKLALMQSDSPQTATFDQGLEATESEFEQDFQEPEKKFGARKSSIKKQVKK